MHVLRCCAALLMLAAVACSGGSVVGPSAGAPGASGAAPNYIGTFPITYTSAAGTCGTSVLPTALKVTGTTPGTGSGGATTLLSGTIVGGAPAFNGSNFQWSGTTNVNAQYPSAYVLDKSLAILSAAGTIPGPFYQLEIDVVVWNPPASTGPEVLVWYNSTTCSEQDQAAILGTPSP
jgi:hypothetical protein